MKAVFITGTDTGVGKTVVAGLLGRHLLDRGLNVITQKWVQTGNRGFPGDIDMHLRLMGKKRRDIEAYLPSVCPYNFRFPSSPHLAARLEKQRVSAGRIRASFKLLIQDHDFVIIEGTGGALVPFNHKRLMIDIAGELNIPVLIVALNRLGAVNHTLLTIEAVKKRGMKIAGIIFNNRDRGLEKLIARDNTKIVKALTGEKVLGVLPYNVQKAKRPPRAFGLFAV